ncbi:TPA: hypothetical protein NKW06_002748 [Vibrio parahaemolyticus]|nr:hypothetical protein [Vibrio parahaemolyticus]HCM1281363.1 hypothetical protein [Vibrio parahaemolyticus]
MILVIKQLTHALLIFMTTFLSLSSSASQSPWEYGDYTYEEKDTILISSTHGKHVWGHTLRLVRNKEYCHQPQILLNLSTTNKVLPPKGLPVTLNFEIGNRIHTISTVVSSNFEIGTTKQVNFNPINLYPVSNLLDDLKEGKRLKVTIIGENAKYFDIKVEEFSLAGFTAHYLKVVDGCESYLENRAVRIIEDYMGAFIYKTDHRYHEVVTREITSKQSEFRIALQVDSCELPKFYLLADVTNNSTFHTSEKLTLTLNSDKSVYRVQGNVVRKKGKNAVQIEVVPLSFDVQKVRELVASDKFGLELSRGNTFVSARFSSLGMQDFFQLVYSKCKDTLALLSEQYFPEIELLISYVCKDGGCEELVNECHTNAPEGLKRVCIGTALYQSVFNAEICTGQPDLLSCMNQHDIAKEKSIEFFKFALKNGGYANAAINICRPLSKHNTSNKLLLKARSELNDVMEGTAPDYNWVDLYNCIDDTYKKITIEAVTN